MIKVGAGDVAAAALGVLAGITIWAITGLALSAAGLQSYALYTALPVALAATAVTGPLIVRRTRSHAPQRYRQHLGILFGTLAFLLYACITVVIVVPENILFFG